MCHLLAAIERCAGCVAAPSISLRLLSHVPLSKGRIQNKKAFCKRTSGDIAIGRGRSLLYFPFAAVGSQPAGGAGKI